MYQDPMSGAPAPAPPPVSGGIHDDLPTIGTPTFGAPGPYVAPAPINPGPYPSGGPGGYPPPGPRQPNRRGQVLLVVGALLTALVAVGALVVVLTVGGSGDDTAAGNAAGVDASTTSVTAPTSTLSTITSTPPTPPPAPTTNLPIATNPPVVQTVPVGAPGSAGGASNGGASSGKTLYGSYVAVLWSDMLSNVSADDIQGYLSQRADQYGVPTAVAYGDDYLTLRDGTVAVVYAGGFNSSREAAQWCRNRGVTDYNACFGVGLNDDHDWQNKADSDRTYITQL